MSAIDELIAELCPDGVEYRKLRDVCLKEKTIQWDNSNDTRFYIDLSSVDINTHAIGELEQITAENAPSRAKQVVKEDDLLFATTRPTQMRCCVIPASLNDQVCSTGYCVLRLKDVSIDVRFAFHCLTTDKLKAYLENNQTEGNYPAISDKKIREFHIPVPPIEVQREVVRILDAFAVLTDELTAKLAEEATARKQQYGYYRDRLLSRESLEAIDGKPVEMVKLGDVCKTVASGKNKERNKSGLYPVFGSTGEIARCDTAAYEGTRILVARVGANAGKTYLVEGDFNVSDNTLVLDPREGTNIKYLLHVLTNANLNQYAKGGGQPLITAGQLKGISIPVPSLATQRKVAGILDRFDALMTSLADGLPAEIAARRQQYEYYRDRLLDLPRKDADAA